MASCLAATSDNAKATANLPLDSFMSSMNSKRSLQLARYFPLAIFLGFVLAMTTCFTFSFAGRSGKGVSLDKSPIAGLPADASDIDYYLPGLMGRDIYFEFQTSEEEFRKWVEGYESVSFQKQATSNFKIERYSQQVKQPQMVEIDKGLLYSWTEGEKGIFIGFDANTKRAYYHTHSD